MNYADAKKMFDKRRKGADFKRAFGYYRLVEVPEGLQFQYEDGKRTPIATVSPESVWTMHLNITASEVHGKMLLRKIVGREILISNDSRSPYANTLRFYVYGVKQDCGYKPGLQYDSINRKVLNAEPEGKRELDRGAYKQHKPVLDLTKTLTAALMRLGAVDDTTKERYGVISTAYDNAVLRMKDHVNSGLPLDENYDFSNLITTALMLSVRNTNGLWWQREPQPNWQEIVIRKAREKIRKDLKKVLGVYQYVIDKEGN